jgi:DnaJ-class molecular chaperone
LICPECLGDGIAEYIDVYARPCDACRGEGEIVCYIAIWFKRG